MQSLESNALEPTRKELAEMTVGQRFVRLLPVFGLPILTVLLILFFSIILPDTFPTMLNLRSILGDKAIIAMLSLAAMVPMMAGRIDLTVGYGIVLWHILAISLQVDYGLPWWFVVAVVIGCGLVAGKHRGQAGVLSRHIRLELLVLKRCPTLLLLLLCLLQVAPVAERVRDKLRPDRIDLSKHLDRLRPVL